MAHSLSGKTERATMRAFSKILNALVQVRDGVSTEVLDAAIDQASSAVTFLGILHDRQRNERAKHYKASGFDIDRVEERD